MLIDWLINCVNYARAGVEHRGTQTPKGSYNCRQKKLNNLNSEPGTAGGAAEGGAGVDRTANGCARAVL